MPNKTAEEVRELVLKAVPEWEGYASIDRDRCVLTVPKDKLEECCQTAKEHQQLRFTYFSFMCAVDRLAEKQMELVYCLGSIANEADLWVHTRINREGEEGEEAPTLSYIYAGANFHERECYDLHGVRFSNHPDLRRMFLPDDYVGHPLRKDFVMPDHPWTRPSPIDMPSGEQFVPGTLAEWQARERAADAEKRHAAAKPAPKEAAAAGDSPKAEGAE